MVTEEYLFLALSGQIRKIKGCTSKKIKTVPYECGFTLKKNVLRKSYKPFYIFFALSVQRHFHSSKDEKKYSKV